MNIRTTLKISAVVLLAAAGVYSAVSAPAAVESFLPTVSTVEVGTREYCETVSAAGTIEKTDDWYVTAAVGESDIRKISIGQTALLSGAAFDSGRYRAEVVKIADSARQKVTLTSSETVVDVTLRLENPDDDLRSGYTAVAAIEVSQPQDIFTLPYSVIRQDDAGEYVYALRGSSVVRCDIETGAEFEDAAEVKSGIYLNDKIITSPESVEAGALAKTEEVCG